MPKRNKEERTVMLIVRFVVAVAFVLAVVGCDQADDIHFAPVVTVQADVKDDDGHWHRMSLTPKQTSLLSSWLENHREGWRALMETPPLATFSFSVETTDRHRYMFQVFVRPQGDGVAYVWDGEKVPLEHRLSVDDVRILREGAGVAAP
ncbi:hypothetical protein ACTJK4_21830 [Ralstonia sp. 22111]|uniref:hypothetical protein n=1 Tax=Ralstonia sp. 22111 TaxID=3453878 RepID=UPI003F8452E0